MKMVVNDLFFNGRRSKTRRTAPLSNVFQFPNVENRAAAKASLPLLLVICTSSLWSVVGFSGVFRRLEDDAVAAVAAAAAAVFEGAAAAELVSVTG